MGLGEEPELQSRCSTCEEEKRSHQEKNIGVIILNADTMGWQRMLTRGVNLS